MDCFASLAMTADLSVPDRHPDGELIPRLDPFRRLRHTVSLFRLEESRQYLQALS